MKVKETLHKDQILDMSAVKSWLEESGRNYQRKVSELSLLRRLTDSISLDLDLEKACDFIQDILLEELDTSNTSIMLFDETRQELILKCAKGHEDETANYYNGNDLFDGICLKKGEGVAGRVFQEGQPTLINAVDLDSRFLRDNKQAVKIGSLLCLPLIIRGKAVGVLNLSHSEKNKFSRGDVPGLTIVANQIATLLDNAQNYNKLQEINLHLETKVKERTRHLEEANRELQETRSCLVKSEKLKALGEMASGVAHDFNNTLAGIIGNTELLLAELNSPQVKERLEAIDLTAKDGAATVKRIQEFSRVKKTTEFYRADVNELVRDVVKITSPLWKDKPQKQGKIVDLVTNLGDVEAVAGNPAELREVLTNIVINALDVLSNRGKITISTWANDASVFIAISDNGVGMSADVQDRIFDPFFTTKGPGNSGLGLSVTYGIVHRHEGEISVESVQGKGTTFTIQLPFCKEPIEVPQTKVEKKSAKPARILLIDDENRVREVLTTILEKAGHEVISAGGGREGLEVFDPETFEMVFTDLGMPDLSGWEVASAVKERSPTTPVVMITGWGRELDQQEIKQQGVDFLLAKPFKLIKVQNVVAEAQKLWGPL